MTCLVSGTIALFVAVAYPYALLAIKGNREETEEIRSIVHLLHHSMDNARDHSRGVWERDVLRLTGLDSPRRPWIYFHHPTLHQSRSEAALSTVCGLPLDGSLCSGHSSRISFPRHRCLLGLGQYSAHPFADDAVIAPRSHL